MIDAFLSNHDIHAATAAKIYKIDLQDVGSDMRRKAKTANFGIIYGISVFGLAERMNVERKEAKELIDGYFETYPGVKAYMDKSIQVAQEKAMWRLFSTGNASCRTSTHETPLYADMRNGMPLTHLSREVRQILSRWLWHVSINVSKRKEYKPK